MRMGKFYELVQQIGRYILYKKKFIYLAPDYVVVGLSAKEYKKHFPEEKKNKTKIFFDDGEE